MLLPPSVRHLAPAPFGAAAIDRFQLGNGLSVLVLPDHSAPVVAMQLWFAVGSRHEHQGKTGIAHLFEHLMFGETATLAHGEFFRRLEALGVEVNAATYVDWTVYHAKVPADVLPDVMALEAGRMQGLILREPQVATEREVVANERRMRVDDDVDGRAGEVLWSTAFTCHGYGHNTVGAMTDILAFTPADCEAFYRTYYAPNNATLVLVGDITAERAVELAHEHFGAFAPSVLPVEQVQPEPPQVGERRVELALPTSLHKALVGYKSPALGDVDYVPMMLLNEVLFDGRSSRVERALIQDLELASDVRGLVASFRDPGLYEISLSARDGVGGAMMLRALDKVLAEVVEQPVTQAELDQAKAKFELSVYGSLETANARAWQIGNLATLYGRPAMLFDMLTAVETATVGDLLRVARRYLVPTARTVVFVAPQEVTS